MALSFARDYEQGLMQTLLSSPVSRSSLFIIKFLAVIVPLVFLSWGFTTLIMVLNFYLDTAALFTILGVTAWILPFMLLALMF
jgi:ABC-type transport system involved in multi-copper enzyme maturation permease subunit